jgi:hypothetical protein
VQVWVSFQNDISTILAQRFDRGGKALGVPIVVAADPSPEPTTPTDFNPAVAGTADGGFIVAWVRLAGPTAAFNAPPLVLASRYDVADQPVWTAQQLSTGLASGDRPSIAVDGAGRTFVAWTFVDSIEPFTPSHFGVVLRRISPAGVLIGDEIVVAPPLANSASVSVTANRGRMFVVTWHTDVADPSDPANPSGILARRYRWAGVSLGDVVVSSLGQQQKSPRITHDPAANFVIVWESADPDHPGVLGRRFAGDGTALGGEFAVTSAASPEGLPFAPDVAAIGPGSDFVVVWSAGPIYGRRFTVR